jgi:anti-anti-sigma factor
MSVLAPLHLEALHDGILVTCADTELNAIAAALLARNLFALAEEQGSQHWYLDLGSVPFLSNGMLKQLLRLAKHLNAQGGRLSLRNLNPLVYEVLQTCRLTDLLDAQLPWTELLEYPHALDSRASRGSGQDSTG